MSQASDEEDEENYVYSDDEEEEEQYMEKEETASETASVPAPSKKRERSDSQSVRQRLGDSEYVLIDRSDVAQTMAKKAREVSELLNVSSSCAEALLRGAGWSNERLLESFWSDGEALQKKCGVLEWGGSAETPFCEDGLPGLDSDVPLPDVKTNSEGLVCRICFCDVEPGEALGAPCGHLFCADCYEAYLSNKLEDEGQACVSAQCPEDKCVTLIPPNLWNKALSGGRQDLRTSESTATFAASAAAEKKKAVSSSSSSSSSSSFSAAGLPAPS